MSQAQANAARRQPAPDRFRGEDKILETIRAHLQHAAREAGLERFKNEDTILETFRAHLRHAKRHRANGDMTFKLRLKDGGPTGFYVGGKVVYEFLEPLDSPENGLRGGR